VPFRACVVEVPQLLPGVGELAIESVDRNAFQAVARGDGGVDVTDGRPRPDESAANVEGDRPDLEEWINGLMD